MNLKNNNKTLQFYFRDDQIQYRSERDYSIYIPSPIDHLVLLRPNELHVVVESYLTNWVYYSDDVVENLVIVNETNAPINLGPIFDLVEPELCSDSTIEIHACQIDQEDFVRLIETWTNVYLCGCELTEETWEQPAATAKCSTLWIQNCYSYLAVCKEGSITWPSLTNLNFSQYYWNQLLHGVGVSSSDTSLNFRSSAPKMSPVQIQGLLGPTVQALTIDRCEDVSCLTTTSCLTGLQSLDLNGSPCTKEVFNWICNLSSLKYLELSWFPDEAIDCRLLSRLKRLRRFVATSQGFDDEDVLAIAESCRYIRSLRIYYSSVTPASWSPALSMKFLRTLWVSTEMTRGELPGDLPDSTGLKEIVAMNTLPGMLPEIQAKYPWIEIVDM